MKIKDITPGTAMWLCLLCGNVTEQQFNKEGCICECKERHGEEYELQIYLGYSIVIEDGCEEVETTVYRFYSIRDDTVWSSDLEGFDETLVY
tara:strand:- start:844 stop:1119 length:276 start_codon:yes stop_codon:yes gene_type:complete